MAALAAVNWDGGWAPLVGRSAAGTPRPMRRRLGAVLVAQTLTPTLQARLVVGPSMAAVVAGVMAILLVRVVARSTAVMVARQVWRGLRRVAVVVPRRPVPVVR